MSFSYRRFSSLLVLSVFLVIANSAPAQQLKAWQNATADELKQTTPKVEADADAEVLLWDVTVTDEQVSGGDDLQTVLNHYQRIKIYNDRGREAFSKIDIPYGKIQGVGTNVQIKNISARTTKADGTVVELKDSDIFDRDIIKGNGIKLKAKSFAVPGIEAGAIIEYRWKEVRGGVSYYQRLQFAQEIPVQLVQYHIKPLPHPELGLAGQPFNAHNTPFKRDSNNYYSTSMSNVPSFKEEPRMAPEYALRPWLLLYYTKFDKKDPEQFWKEFGKKAYDTSKGMMKPSDDIKQKTAEVVAGATDPDAKIRKIFDFVRANVKNMRDDALHLTPDEIKKLKDNKNPSETLKRGQGTWRDINMLFAAMTTAAGFETRLANLSRRSDIFFPKWFPNDYFIRTEDIAIKVGSDWRFFDPSSKYVPYGMLRWEEEGVTALVSDPNDALWVTTPMSPSSSSVEKRTGKFKLLDDGTLEGDVKIETTGHIAATQKEYNDDDSPQERETTLKDLVKENVMPSAEVSDIKIENVTDPDKPFIYEFKMRVPGYATRTGKRMFVQPGVFERSTKPMFEAATRKHEIYFEYPYSEKDDITIEIPANFDLESPDAPGIVSDKSGIGVDEVTLQIGSDHKTIWYTRNFSFGNGGNIRFGEENYAALKGLFEAFYRANSHALTLKQKAQ